MEITATKFTVNKTFALTISRGTTTKTDNIWLTIKQDHLEGWGEASAFSVSQDQAKPSINKLLKDLQTIIPKLNKFNPWQREEIYHTCQIHNLDSSLRAAIDTALHDWLGKKANLPLYQVWGFNLNKIRPISVTIGISSPENAHKRLKNWQNIMPANFFKLKLGNPAGIEADQAMVLAVRNIAPQAKLTVDANGGWNLTEAITMAQWLAQQHVEYIEQPLAVGAENQLSELYNKSPLPIFVDESCFTSQDILKLADRVHGVNIKLMKTGGLGEALRTIYLAKACGLKVMYGCYSDSSLANTAMAHLAPLADYLDLDSHLNLKDDPFRGAVLDKNGRLLPRNLPGLGVEYCGHHSSN